MIYLSEEVLYVNTSGQARRTVARLSFPDVDFDGCVEIEFLRQTPNFGVTLSFTTLSGGGVENWDMVSFWSKLKSL